MSGRKDMLVRPERPVFSLVKDLLAFEHEDELLGGPVWDQGSGI